MKRGLVFSSALGPMITSYLDLRFALGQGCKNQITALRSVDRFVSKLPLASQDLTAKIFHSWSQTQSGVSAGTRRYRMLTIRKFCLYRRRTLPECFVPDSIFFPTPGPTRTPYIFSESEVAHLMSASARLRRRADTPLRPEVIRLAIVLLYTTGVRISELLRLVVDDLDFREGTALIRASKFHKSRVLPLPRDVIGEIKRYLQIRRQHGLPVLPSTPLIWNRRNGARPYAPTGLHNNLKILLDACNVRSTSGRRPCVHDFRHSCAVNALIRWYRSGADVRTKLPFLAAYLGHVSIVSTYRYLHFIEPLSILASSRFCDGYGGLITAEQQGGRA